MPEFFKQWLLSLSKEQAKEMWNYYDGTHFNDLIQNVVEILVPKAKGK
jgi:hypothetical protein